MTSRVTDDLDDADRFVELALTNEHNQAILDRAPALGSPTGG